MARFSMCLSLSLLSLVCFATLFISSHHLMVSAKDANPSARDEALQELTDYIDLVRSQLEHGVLDHYLKPGDRAQLELVFKDALELRTDTLTTDQVIELRSRLEKTVEQMLLKKYGGGNQQRQAQEL